MSKEEYDRFVKEAFELHKTITSDKDVLDINTQLLETMSDAMEKLDHKNYPSGALSSVIVLRFFANVAAVNYKSFYAKESPEYEYIRELHNSLDYYLRSAIKEVSNMKAPEEKRNVPFGFNKDVPRL